MYFNVKHIISIKFLICHSFYLFNNRERGKYNLFATSSSSLPLELTEPECEKPYYRDYNILVMLICGARDFKENEGQRQND